MKLDAASIIVAAKGHSAAAVGEEIVILGIRAGRYYGVNRVGARIWQLIQTPTSLAAVRDAIVAEYEVEAARCEAEVIVLAEQLLAAQLVDLQPSIASDLELEP